MGMVCVVGGGRWEGLGEGRHLLTRDAGRRQATAKRRASHIYTGPRLSACRVCAWAVAERGSELRAEERVSCVSVVNMVSLYVCGPRARDVRSSRAGARAG